MPHKARAACPAGLQAAGKRLWRGVANSYSLRPDELAVLESACKTADTIAALEVAMVGQPLTTVGSMQQQREHPLLSEARQQRAALVRFLAQLKLPDDDQGFGSRSVAARKAANARWSKPAAGSAPWHTSRSG